MIIGVRLIQLHKRKFRIVARIDALVAEHAADLIHTLKAADDQALEVQFKRDAQAHILVQRVIMRLERARGGAARIGDEHRGLDLNEALRVKIAADAAYHLGALDESVLHVGVHNEVGISLTVAEVNVCQAVIFLRQYLKALGQQHDLGRADGGLAGFRDKNLALDADDIADIELLEVGIRLFADHVARDVYLDIALKILHMAEGRLAHDALGHHSARDADGLTLKLRDGFFDLLAVMRDVILGYLERILAAALEISQFIAPYLQQLGQILRLIVVDFAHTLPLSITYSLR